jgi:hypothetical protein
MTIARAQLVDSSVTRWYHCVTRCVRKAFLLGEGDDNRKEWIANGLLPELAESQERATSPHFEAWVLLNSRNSSLKARSNGITSSSKRPPASCTAEWRLDAAS